MLRLVRLPLAAGAVIALAAAGCGAGGDSGPESEAAGLDTTAAGYVQPGTEFWDGWKVPEGTVLLGTPFPQPDRQHAGLPEETEGVVAEFLVTGDAYEVMGDLHEQVREQGLRPVVMENDPEVCENRFNGSEYLCRLYGEGDDGHLKFEARLSILGEPRPSDPNWRLTVELGEYDYNDISDHPNALLDADPPEGSVPIEPPDVDRSTLLPGAEMPFYGKEEPVGEIPEGARMLEPSYSPSPTYGFAAVFVVTDERALDEFERMSAGAATGERYPDQELLSGDLVGHRISFDGSAGGCGVELDTVELTDHVIARLYIACD